MVVSGVNFPSFELQNFERPKQPFKRMNYADAIVWLKKHDVKKDDGTYYEFGEVSPSRPPMSPLPGNKYRA